MLFYIKLIADIIRYYIYMEGEMITMSEILKKKLKKLSDNGLKENKDFRVIYFGNWFEIKYIKNSK